MLNNKENNLPTWIFFSNVDATLVNESARQLLAWSGESFGRLPPALKIFWTFWWTAITVLQPRTSLSSSAFSAPALRPTQLHIRVSGNCSGLRHDFVPQARRAAEGRNMRSGEITFKLSNDVFNDAVELVARKTSLMGAVNHPIAGDIEARMLDDVAKQLGKTLLTKSQKIRFIGRCGVQTEEEK